MDGEQIRIMSELAIRFALTAVLTMISAVVWKRNSTANAMVPECSIGRSFACAPYPVRAVAFWGLVEVAFSIWWKFSSDLPISGVVAIAAVNALKWVVIVLCMLKGHKWPRFYFLIVGCLTLADGLYIQTKTHAWSTSAINSILNGFLGIVLYYLLSINESMKWRDAVRAARINR